MQIAKVLKQKLIAHTSIYSAIYGSTSWCDIIHRPVGGEWGSLSQILNFDL